MKIRERTNKYFAKSRRKKLKDANLTIISNNCWGAHVYRYYGMKYLSPTIGLYFYSEDYIKFLKDIKKYLQAELTFIPIEKSKYSKSLIEGKKDCPIGVIDDIEIVFLHYKTEEDAKETWNRRKERINFDNMVVKISEQNFCTEEHLREFDELPFKRKLAIVSRDYGLKSQVVHSGLCGNGVVKDDIVDFRKDIKLANWINGEEFRKHQKKAKRKAKRRERRVNAN